MYQTILLKLYINIFSKIMLIFCFSIQSISRLSTYFILWSFRIWIFICYIIVRPLRGRFTCINLWITKTINPSHLFWLKFFRFSISARCSKRIFCCTRFGRLFDISESRIYIHIWKFNEILISVNFFLLIGTFFLLSHRKL